MKKNASFVDICHVFFFFPVVQRDKGTGAYGMESIGVSKVPLFCSFVYMKDLLVHSIGFTK